MLTTEGINSSTKSAKLSGIALAVKLFKKIKKNKKKYFYKFDSFLNFV